MTLVVGPKLQSPKYMILRTRAGTLDANEWDPEPLPKSHTIAICPRIQQQGGLNGEYDSHSIREGVHIILECLYYSYHCHLDTDIVIVLYNTCSGPKVLALTCGMDNSGFISYWRLLIEWGRSQEGACAVNKSPVSIGRARYNIAVDSLSEPSTSYIWQANRDNYGPLQTYNQLNRWKATARSNTLSMLIRCPDGYCDSYGFNIVGMNNEFVTIKLHKLHHHTVIDELNDGVQFSTLHKIYNPSEYSCTWYYSIDTIQWCGNYYNIALTTGDKPQVHLVHIKASAIATVNALTSPRTLKFDAVLSQGNVYSANDLGIHVTQGKHCMQVFSPRYLYNNDNTHDIVIKPCAHYDNEMIKDITNLMVVNGFRIHCSYSIISWSVVFGNVTLTYEDSDKNIHICRLKNVKRHQLIRWEHLNGTYFSVVPWDIAGIVNTYLSHANVWERQA